MTSQKMYIQIQIVVSHWTRKHSEVKGKRYQRQKTHPAAPNTSLLLFFMLMVVITAVSGVLTSTPSDVAVVNGTSVNLRCSTDTTEDLLWYRLSPGAQSEDHIAEGSQVNDKFRHFYSVQHENQESNLTIVAEQSTAARYTCVEIFTMEQATAQVIVLESEPSCSGNVTGYMVNLTCIVKFRGHGNPNITWTQFTGTKEKEITGGIENTQREGHLVTLTSTLTVQVNEREMNHFQVYRYTVKFCVPDNAVKVTDGGLCIFSQMLYIGEETNETTERMDEEGRGGSGAGLRWLSLIAVPVVVIPVGFGISHIYHSKTAKNHGHPKDEHPAAREALVEESL